MIVDDRTHISIVMKEWGFEKHITSSDRDQYCGRLLYVVGGKSTNLHYHNSKDETIYIQSGKVHVLFFDSAGEEFEKAMAQNNGNIIGTMDRVTLNQGDNFWIPPGRIHQILAVQDAQLFEFSNKHRADDVVNISSGV